jgi:hypothetical protein
MSERFPTVPNGSGNRSERFPPVPPLGDREPHRNRSEQFPRRGNRSEVATTVGVTFTCGTCCRVVTVGMKVALPSGWTHTHDGDRWRFRCEACK